jgi:hypothetical protein
VTTLRTGTGATETLVPFTSSRGGASSPSSPAAMLEGRVRTLAAKPRACAALTLHAPSFEGKAGGVDALRQLLQHRVVAPGAGVHLAGLAGGGGGMGMEGTTATAGAASDASSSSAAAANATVVSAEPACAPGSCWRVTPNTRITLSDAPTTTAVQPSTLSPGNTNATPGPGAAHTIAGAEDVLAALREAILWPMLHAVGAVTS